MYHLLLIAIFLPPVCLINVPNFTNYQRANATWHIVASEEIHYFFLPFWEIEVLVSSLIEFLEINKSQTFSDLDKVLHDLAYDEVIYYATTNNGVDDCLWTHLASIQASKYFDDQKLFDRIFNPSKGKSIYEVAARRNLDNGGLYWQWSTSDSTYCIFSHFKQIKKNVNGQLFSPYTLNMY